MPDPIIQRLAIAKKIDKRVDEYRAVKLNLKQERKRLKKFQQYELDVQESKEVALTIFQTIQRRTHKRIASVVATALRNVFGPCYDFRIDFVTKRGRTEAKLLLIKNGHEVEDPKNNDSGGVCDISSLTLRIANMLLRKPWVNRILIGDEPFNTIAKQNLPALISILEEIQSELKVQIIIVSHYFEIGKVVRL